MNKLPIIRLEVDEMRHQVMHHLGHHHQELEGIVEEKIEEAIKSFNFEDIVFQEVNKALSQAVRHYFEYGKGRESIKSAMEAALSGMFDRGHGSDNENGDANE